MIDDHLLDFLEAVHHALSERKQLEIKGYLYGKSEEDHLAVEYARNRGLIGVRSYGDPKDLFVYTMTPEAERMVRDRREKWD